MVLWKEPRECIVSHAVPSRIYALFFAFFYLSRLFLTRPASHHQTYPWPITALLE